MAALGIAAWMMFGYPSPSAPIVLSRAASASPVLATQPARISVPAANRPLADTREGAAFTKRAVAIEKLPRDAEREKAVRELAQEWTAKAPGAAENWAASLADAAERETALTHVSLTAANSDPATAMEMAQWYHLPPGTVQNLAQIWGKKDFSAALGWASDLSPGPAKEVALSRIFLTRAESDPAGAATLVSERLAPGPMQEEAAISVLYYWLRRDTIAASAWVAQFPPGKMRTRAENEVRGFFAQRNDLSSAPP